MTAIHHLPATPSGMAPAPVQLTTWPLLRLGFRPFYLLAALFAVVSVPLWLASYLGARAALAQVQLLWHMHEMVFGFGSAVIVGFLFTAARNWTGMWTPRGLTLALLSLLWLAGRVAQLLLPQQLAAAIDLLFLPLATLALYRVMWRSGKRNNLPLLVLPSLIALANLVYYAALIAADGQLAIGAVQAALLLIVLLASVLGGRVIPGFTANTSGARITRDLRLDRAGLALLVAASLAWLAPVPGWLCAALCGAAALLHFWRMAGWGPRHAAAYPLLWVLHLGYAWIGIGFLLLGAAALGWVGASSALHALALGAMSGLILGMITRTALGHTGRPLVAGKAETAMFVALQAGALLRLGANLLPADYRVALLLASGGAWSAAFLLYLVVYAPYLGRTRVDGRDG